MLDERAYIIIQKILERPFIEKKDLLSKCNLTPRQLEYSLEKINDYLKTVSGKSIVLNSYDQLTVDEEMKEILLKEVSRGIPDKTYIFRSQERMKFIYFMLFLDMDYLSMNHFMDALKVGKTTIISDIKVLNANLLETKISVEYNRKKGYCLQGNELDIRNLMMRMIIFELNEDSNPFLLNYFLQINNMDDFQSTKAAIIDFMNKYNITFVENRLTEFVYSFIFLKQRLSKTIKNKVKPSVLSRLKTKKEYKFAEELSKYYHCDNEDMISYLCAWILGLSMGNVDENDEDFEMIMNLVEQIRNRFESFSGIHFDHPAEVSKQLYQHFRSTFYRLYYDLPIVNPLYQKIKEEYEDLYLIVSETLKPIASVFGKAIPKEEIAYLTIHFASLAKNFYENQIKQKVALIVCPNGVGSSSITYTVLKSIFPEFKFLFPIETKDIDKLQENYDMVFSTVPDIRLFYTKKPVYIVSPVMNVAEKYRLIRDVYTENGNSVFKLPSVDEIVTIVEKYAKIKDEGGLKKALYDHFVVNENVWLEKEQRPNLSNITSPRIIQLNQKAANWQEAISLSAQPMVEEELITKQYVAKMIDNAVENGPYMVIMKNVALPHARPIDGVNKLSIGITVLSEPLLFCGKIDKPVKYIFCLATTDSEKHLNALSQLLRYLENNEFYKIMESSNSPDEVYNFICQNEN